MGIDQRGRWTINYFEAIGHGYSLDGAVGPSSTASPPGASNMSERTLVCYTHQASWAQVLSMERAGRVPMRLTNRYSDRKREFEFEKSLLGLEPRVPHHSGAVVFTGTPM